MTKACVISAANSFSHLWGFGHTGTLEILPGQQKGTKATHLEPDSGLEVTLDGSGITRGATETKQGFIVEVCAFEKAGVDPEVEEAALAGTVPGPTDVPQLEPLLMGAQVSTVAGSFRDPSETQ